MAKMKGQADLISWLSRPHLDDLGRLKLSIKVWNSIDYPNLSKHEILVRYFCSKLPDLCHLGENLSPDTEDFVNLWETIREFIELEHPIGAVTSETKSQLIEALVENLVKLDIKVLSVLKATTENTSFGSFFSSNVLVYGKLMRRYLISWRLILEGKCPTKESQKGITDDLLNNLKTFAQFQANNLAFRKIYLEHIHQPLTELVIFLMRSQIDCKRFLFGVIREIFFSDDSVKWYKTHFETSDKVLDVPENYLMFKDDCLHVSLMNIEGFLFTFHGNNGLCTIFVDYLFRDVFVPGKMEFTDLVLGINHTLMLLKTYNIKLSSGHGDFYQKIREILLKIVEEFAENNTGDCLILVLRTMQLNPLIFIDHLPFLILKFLFLPKNDEIMQIFSEFFAFCLETFHKLSRFDKSLSKLLEAIHSAVITMEFPKKLKRKLKKPEPSTKRQKINENGAFLEILTEKDCVKHKKIGKSESEAWSEISFAWSEEISRRFSRIILSLMPNASLIVWKSLIYSVLNALDCAKDRQFDENSLFYLEFTCKMLCAYFQGSRLLEKPDNILKKIDERRILMNDLLNKFLEILDAQEGNLRPLKSFLELYSGILDFDMALVVYRPDFVHENHSGNLGKVDYLKVNTWIDNQNKMIDDTDIRDLFCSLQLKRLKLRTIENKHQEKALENLPGILQDVTIFRRMAVNLKDYFWITKSLSRKGKITLAQMIVEKLDTLYYPKILDIFEDEEFLIVFLLVTFQVISQKINAKKSPFCKINFSELMSGDTFDDIPKEILTQVKPVNLKGKLSHDQEDLKDALDKLKNVPIGFLCKEEKNKCIFFLLLLQHTLIDFVDLEKSLLDILVNLTELGNEISIFGYISVGKVIEMFPNVEKQRKLYDILFAAAIKWQSEDNIKSFTELVTILEIGDSPLNRHLSMIAVENFSKYRKFHKFEKETINLRSKLSLLALKSFKNVENIDGYLSAFVATLRIFFTGKENLSKTHEDLGKISLKFINHSIRKSQLGDLLKIVVDNRELLGISHEILMLTVMDFWQQMRQTKEITSKNSEIANIILTLSKPEEFANVLRILKDEIKTENALHTCQILQSFGLCNMNEEQAKIFSTFYKDIIGIISDVCSTFSKGESMELILDILKSHTIYVKNTKIPLPNSFFHNILTFLVEINLKQLKLNIKDFSRLHLQMTEFCHAVNQHRSSCLRFTMPQFVYIFKDLIHGICGYRSDRSKNEKLDQEEIDILTQLAHKLELMIAFMASKNKKSKRVAPFMLIFVINEMIYNQNSTSVYPSIKTHINNICYSLIAMCDANYGQFILRSCSESSRNVYKTLLSDYTKYYKFQGKI
ncbi:uncharacterized protein LOC129801813 [Phlebotomus papatasi]|nr:uncharacterized protein LOC129801813 [Phlebotomus papatasi]